MDKAKAQKTVRIRIWGIVQGVGFRPFIAKLADRLGITGEVRNVGGLVDIVTSADEETLTAFLAAIRSEKPLPAEIVHIDVTPVAAAAFSAFTIVDSGEGGDEATMLPADLALCPDCLAELHQPGNPRSCHPFISCMACGPRYSIIDRIPYDRDNTAMIDFPMCSFCHGEYTDRKDRRYHAQTISCHDCGPVLLYRTGDGRSNEGQQPCGDIARQVEEPLAAAAQLLREGKIIALKGVGGYYFVCSPFQEEAVAALRRLKLREEKPFAVMFPNLAAIREYCFVTAAEERLLASAARPIVLLEKREGLSVPIVSGVYQSSRFTGAFLPGMGLQYLLTEQCGPLIMTSANLSDRPICKDETEIFSLWQEAGTAAWAGIFYNTRDIRIRLDDSVGRVIDGQPQMIRRSKGYAPTPLYISNGLTKEDMIFAAGGQLKSAFSLSKGPFAYVSQYFGDLDSQETMDIYRENVRRMAALFRIKPVLAVCDLHPLYAPTQFCRAYAEEQGIPLLQVQHHHAHVASVMAEHNLKGCVLGVSFDGTGYGTDGAVWGGEFLLCEGGGFRRAAHLQYVEMLGGDGSMKEGWKSAFCYGHHYLDELPATISGDARWPLVKAGLAHHINTIQSSSMGRLFDAVAAFAGIHAVNRYEGECAIQLENAASGALQAGVKPYKMRFEVEKGIISAAPIFRAIAEGLAAGREKNSLALGFHDAVADMILEVCQWVRAREGPCPVALTGGVFQNKILMEKVLARLRAAKFDVYYNISVAPNDNGICLGQNYIGMERLAEVRKG